MVNRWDGLVRCLSGNQIERGSIVVVGIKMARFSKFEFGYKSRKSVAVEKSGSHFATGMCKCFIGM